MTMTSKSVSATSQELHAKMGNQEGMDGWLVLHP